MASILKMFILGIVQAATEFLPVSSSGHLTVARTILGTAENSVLAENWVLFVVFLHVGTVIAILLVFGKDVLALFSSKRRWIPYLVLASLPAAVVGFSLESHVKRAFESLLAVGGLLVGNSLILAAGSVAQRRAASATDPKTRGALVVGLAQSVAILPGISRSGSTVCSGLLMGWDRTLAVRFSFLLAIPAIVGATGFEAMKCRSSLASSEVWAMALTGALVSAAVGYAALRLFLTILKRGKLWVFAGYCFVLGTALVVYKLAA